MWSIGCIECFDLCILLYTPPHSELGVYCEPTPVLVCMYAHLHISVFLSELECCLSVFLPRLKDFHGLLERRPQGFPEPIMHTTAGPLDPPLGNTRLQVVRLFAAILQCGNVPISKEVIRLSTFSTLIVSLTYMYT